MSSIVDVFRDPNVKPSGPVSGEYSLFRATHRHMEVPRLGVESELQLPTYATATAMQDPSPICDLHHSSRQRHILNPLVETRD